MKGLDGYTAVQRRTLFAVFERCAEIRELSEFRGEETLTLVPFEVEPESLQPEIQALKRELAFARKVEVWPCDFLTKIKEQVLPERFHPYFKPPKKR